MEENVEPYTFDLNLDFLDSATTNIKNVPIAPEYQTQSQSNSTFDIESLANRISTVNDMAIQVKATKDENLRLQKQMQDLSESAMSIRCMYDQEKAERLKFSKLYRELQENYEQTQSQLTNKTLNFEQMQSRLELEAEDKKPIPYSDLALKYQRLALQLDENKQLHAKEKITLQLVKDYLESKKLAPLPVFKKKSNSSVKSEVRDFSMQYNFKVESKSKESQCSSKYPEEEPKDTCTQGTQYTWYTTTRGTNTPALSNAKREMKTQGTQYISSTTTRGTSTSTFIKTQSVGTNFPEPVPPVSIEDIFKEMICDVSPLSPMSASPQTELKEEKVEMKSIGTCTDLKNVRKPIDYVAANIKSSDSRPPSRNNNLYDRVKNEIPLMGMPTLNPFAGLGIPVTPMHNTVTELWNMLGHTIFALLQQNGGAAAAPSLNPMHMSVLNDRMRNLSGRNRTASGQQRNCESQTRDEYYEQEYPREYSTTTRSAATSPILSSELEINQPPSRSSFDATVTTPDQHVDIQKILLHTNFSDPVVSSSRKSSQVDEILQLFPEYSDSFKKRKAIKKLLKESNKNKKPKKQRNSNSCSSSSSVSASTQSTTEIQTMPASSVLMSASPKPEMELPQTKLNLQANWKTEIFGDCDSDSSLDSSIMDYMRAHTPQADPEDKWIPIETKPPPNGLEWPNRSSTLEIKRTRIKSPIEDEFLGFDEETYLPPTSDEVFCKPFLPAKPQKSVILPDSSIQKTQQRIKVDPGCSLKSKIESNEEPQLAKPPNPKRKRRAKKVDSNQTNKIYKPDETPILLKTEAQLKPNKPKKSLSLNKIKGIVKSILPITATSSDSVNKPLRSLSLKKIKQEPKQLVCVPQNKNQTNQTPMNLTDFNKPDWMNRKDDPEEEDLSIHMSRNHHGPMVMKVEKPPDSVFEDIKTCFSNQKQDSIMQDIKTCFINPKQERDTKPFIGPIMPNQVAPEESVVLPEQSIPFVAPTEDGTFRFLLQNQQSTINTNINSSISPTNSPENSFKILNYCETASAKVTPERNTNSSITILNEQWISQSNDLKGAKQESIQSIVSTEVSRRPLDPKALDLENMPIYFLDDQNLLRNPEQPNGSQLTFETYQGTPYHCPNVTILPGFQEIKQGLKTRPTQFIAPSNRDFQKEELQISKPNDGPQLNRLPVIVQDFPNSFLQNSMPMNIINSIPTVRDVKPMVTTQQDKTSYLVLNHKKQLNFCKESLICTKMEDKMGEELEVLSPEINFNEQENLNTNPKIDLRVSNSPNGEVKDLPRPITPKDKKDPMTQEKRENPSMLLLQNQNSFGSKILRGTTSNEDISRYNTPNESEIVEMQSPIAVPPLSNASLAQKSLETPHLEPKINNFETHFSVVEHESREPSLQEKITPKSPISGTSMRKDDMSSSSDSDSEGDLSIDFPPSPQPINSSSLDLSTILKTPEEAYNPEVQFKTPESLPRNDSLITKVITNSTEKLVEEYLLNESPGEEGPKFQVFLDRILDDVAPPSSPISALASSEKPNQSETESSCDETSTTPIKYKRKKAATAAIAVKRSARINAKKMEATTSMVDRLCAMTIPNIEFGKYTKRKTEKPLIKQEKLVEPNKEEKINIKMGFFQEAMDEEDEEPTCEPIRRNLVEEFKAGDENVAEESLPSSTTFKRKLETEIASNSVKSKLNTSAEDHKQLSVPLEVDSYLSLYKKAKESISLYLKADESKRSPIVDSSTNSLSTNFEESTSFCDESPASPPPADKTPTETQTVRESFELSPLASVDMNSSRKTVISHLISNYNSKHHNMLDKGQKFNKNLLAQLELCIKEFLSGLCLMVDIIRFVDSILNLTSDDKIISKAIVNVLKVAPRPETEVTGPIPDAYLSQTHCKLLNVLRTLCHHFPNLHCHLQSTIEQSMFTFTKEIIPIEVLLNLTQFYLAIINNPTGGTNPARLFICKCLYFFNVKAIPMIYHTLCVYPTVLPQRIDSTYDRSDVLISTIQSILMSTYYDPEKCDFMSRQILAKLRMFYNYENFKPPRDEVIENMMAKIRAGRFKNVSYALAVICKRMEQAQTEKFILNERLMPLANEFYHTLSESSENDEKIACVLECISFVIKPFSVNTDISQYVNLFGRFLNAATERKVIQEAAVAAILRTSRFGYVQCFNAIYNFKPTYELSETLKLMLRSFVYKKGMVFLRALERQAQEIVAT